MSYHPSMSPTDDVPPADLDRSLRDELYWLTPIVLALVGLVAFLLFNQSWGANVAGILTLPVEAAGVVMSILIARGVWGRGRGGGVGRPRRRRRALAAGTAVVIAVVCGGIYLWEREPDPFDFLAGD